ncbi:class I SAM-dependent methyltransferase [Sulfurospirillum sp. T05]|uniref:Class I SAM-dependent methyltransferase n=1 Tax=Sulfurospirillum tamanense TaxID=2813362 RepID=A0ABS2WS48_9BACT|nr:class I SAM-dependent methyltransferase [Sulfurospirillum tamanensis]MBN2964465.1 class I SAM-dependent methyltransferase [Sulfurospirillum tamanensis]
MSSFGDIYSKYYDLLYGDKDYVGEVDYVIGLLNSFGAKEAKTVLDLGCGTGKHAELFCEKGYVVHGVDSSKDMLKIAQSRRSGREDGLSFSCSKIQHLNLKKKFDVVTSLFHVMGYQNSNEDLVQAFRVAKEHLQCGGLFIFDFWYGPAVLTDLPKVKVKRFENKFIKITRIAEPALRAQENVVDIEFDVFIEDKFSNNITQKKEIHSMRYFFDTELELICHLVDFEILEKYAWMRQKSLGFDSWNAVWILKAK